ncbi:family 10 glycosylhydrolase [Anaerocolumna sedimenticola]|uniref:Family 10 glycosylhydrolase n=1 Tax=Anaerocolumna sedimenticola TaxID=2696063 RepID=A0A6P1TQ53_9FIRM|nr:family 10 glycosylhydrolase [Anaerocolumna sedimenticola]QHQ62322.1 family 10 glycosylhydrolase [Anaerocolumna sedimenticola]
MINKNKVQWLSGLLMIFIIGAVLFATVPVYAASDKTDPAITLKADTKEPTNKSIKVEVKVSDASGIKSLKWSSGSKNADYFKKSGKLIKLNSKNVYTVTITANGTYSFYAVDKAGNDSLKKITISNIDITKPAIKVTKSTSDLTKGNVTLSFLVGEKGLGVKSLKYLIGTKTAADFGEAGKSISLTKTEVTKAEYNYMYSGKLTVKTNNTFTFLVEDTAGNKTIKAVTVENIDKTTPEIAYTLSTTKPTKSSVTVNLTATDPGSGVKEAKYLSGEKTAADFTDAGKPTLIKLDSNGKGGFKVSNNGNYTVLATDIVGNQSVKIITISNIDKALPTLSLNYTVTNQKAIITYNAKDTTSGISVIKYLKGNVTDIGSDKWSNAKDVTGTGKFTVTSSGNYSVLVTDKAGNSVIKVVNVVLEFRAVWISYLEYMNYGKDGFTEASFESAIDKMFDKVVDMNMNAVVVHVRPFGDAMYNSEYFPWSRYASGTQGTDPGFDPLEYMVKAAHERGLQIHAWLNPYRVTTASTDYTKLSKDNPARVWHDDKDKTNDRNVLSYAGNLYYNPASKEVQNLITNGVKEIVQNYDVDGIHFDDYFYPSLGSSYATNFDAAEYKTYVSECKESKKTALSIADWRRNNVNTLVKGIYSAIKKIDSSVQFGISPGGFYDSLTSNLGYYVDYKTWLSSDKYIDYICPQIYWTFSNSSYPFDKTLDKWLSFRTSSTVKMYVGIATYKAGSTLEKDWKNNTNELKEQVEYSRDTGKVDGFIFFRYDFFNNKTTKPGVDKLLEIMK